MSAYDALRTALYTTLAGGTALTGELGGTAIYSQQAPEGAPLPYTVFSLQAGTLDNTNGSDLYNSLWFVRGYAASEAQAIRLGSAIDALLHKVNISLTGYRAFWSVKEQDMPTVETPPNESPIYRMGGLYRIRISKA